ncbi:LOW QUALITY PROTEIN: acrosin-like [Glossophaga mutica]
MGRAVDRKQREQREDRGPWGLPSRQTLQGSPCDHQGQAAAHGAWPWTVILQVLACGGSLLNAGWVLTVLTASGSKTLRGEAPRVASAAGAQGGWPGSPCAHRVAHDWRRLVFGAREIEYEPVKPPLQERFVEKIILHESYTPALEANDIALVKITPPVVCGSLIGPARLPQFTAGPPRASQSCWVTGWGSLRENGERGRGAQGALRGVPGVDAEVEQERSARQSSSHQGPSPAGEAAGVRWGPGAGPQSRPARAAERAQHFECPRVPAFSGFGDPRPAFWLGVCLQPHCCCLRLCHGRAWVLGPPTPPGLPCCAPPSPPTQPHPAGSCGPWKSDDRAPVRRTPAPTCTSLLLPWACEECRLPATPRASRETFCSRIPLRLPGLPPPPPDQPRSSFQPRPHTDPLLPVCMATGVQAHLRGCGARAAAAAPSSPVAAQRMSPTLQEAHVDILDLSLCNSSLWYRGRMRPTNVCAGFPEGYVDTCQGDSGGPLMCRRSSEDAYVVVGITSWGVGCARAKRPGIYTATWPYLNWIASKIGSKALEMIQPSTPPAPSGATAPATTSSIRPSVRPPWYFQHPSQAPPFRSPASQPLLRTPAQVPSPPPPPPPTLHLLRPHLPLNLPKPLLLPNDCSSS